MSFTSSSVAGSQQPSNAPLTAATSNKSESGGCSECNSQLWSSYVVGLLACLLVVGGIFLAFHRWDYLWLAVSGVGVLLILIGASLHYCGGGAGNRRPAAASGDVTNRPQKRKRGSNNQRIVCDVGNQNERLLPSAPPNGLGSTGHNFSVSQLSLNMLPPFFPSYDTVSLGTAQVSSTPSVGPTVNPIMHLNGQSFLLLPIGNTAAESSTEENSLARRLSTHLAILEQQSLSQKRCTETVNFGLVPGLSSFTAFSTTNDLQVISKTPQLSETNILSGSNKVDCEVQTTSASPNHEIRESVINEETDEPIYQVPRSPLTQVDNGNPQSDLNSCDQAVNEHVTPIMLDATLDEITVELDTPEVLTLPSSVNATLVTVQEDTLPNNNTFCVETNETQNVVQECATRQTDISPNLMPVVQVEETMSQRAEIVEQETSQTGAIVVQDSQVLTPEPEWTLPPSYDEVAQPNFKRLGHLKFAYETL